MDKPKVIVSVDEIASLCTKFFVTDCIKTAEANWGASHSSVEMIKRLFTAVLLSKPYADVTEDEIQAATEEDTDGKTEKDL